MAIIQSKVLSEPNTIEVVNKAYEIILYNIGANDATLKTKLGDIIFIPASAGITIKLIAPPKDTFDETIELTNKATVQVIFVLKTQ